MVRFTATAAWPAGAGTPRRRPLRGARALSRSPADDLPSPPWNVRPRVIGDETKRPLTSAMVSARRTTCKAHPAGLQSLRVSFIVLRTVTRKKDAKLECIASMARESNRHAGRGDGHVFSPRQ